MKNIGPIEKERVINLKKNAEISCSGIATAPQNQIAASRGRHLMREAKSVLFYMWDFFLQT